MSKCANCGNSINVYDREVPRYMIRYNRDWVRQQYITGKIPTCVDAALVCSQPCIVEYRQKHPEIQFED